MLTKRLCERQLVKRSCERLFCSLSNSRGQLTRTFCERLFCSSSAFSSGPRIEGPRIEIHDLGYINRYDESYKLHCVLELFNLFNCVLINIISLKHIQHFFHS